MMQTQITGRYDRPYPSAYRLVFLLAAIIMGFLALSGCGASQVEPLTPFAVSEVDLEEAFSYGVPVVIAFGATDGPTTAVLKGLHQELGDKAVIQFVDVAAYPEAKEGYPIQDNPSLMLFTADGKAYEPSTAFDFVLNMLYDINTGELAFTIRKGDLTEEEARILLQDMGLR